MDKVKDCENCALSWETQYLDDIDCGCYVSIDFKENIWCKLPNWICKIKRFLAERKDNKAFEKFWGKE